MRPHFPWREGHEVELLVDGANFFPSMLAAIESARHSVLAEFYLATSGVMADQFIDALTDAAKRGVMVRMIIDGYGAHKLSDSDRAKLQAAGVALVVYNPVQAKKLTQNFLRDHRKLLVVDQELGFLGGAGIDDRYCFKDNEGGPWHDYMVKVSGPAITDLVTLFHTVWLRCTGVALTPSTHEQPKGHAKVRISAVQGMYHQETKSTFLRYVNQARERIWLVTAYFLPTYSIRQALKKAAERGVDVRIMIAGHFTDQPWIYHASKHYYRDLLKAGVKIYEYQPHFLHAKVAIVDDWSSVGSCNFDHWNLRWNLDVNIEVKATEFVAELVEKVESDITHCHAVQLNQWLQRPRRNKLKEASYALLGRVALRVR
ncbi:MAG: phospholipase D-like domain-containing protein [Pontibacterium sp.]